MSRLKVNCSVAPNFAYGLAARKCIDAKARSTNQTPIHSLDFSSIVYLQNSAETIQMNMKGAFKAAFLDYGLGPMVSDWRWSRGECCFLNMFA